MAITKQLSVYNNNAWYNYDIGANASNVSVVKDGTPEQADLPSNAQNAISTLWNRTTALQADLNNRTEDIHQLTKDIISLASQTGELSWAVHIIDSRVIDLDSSVTILNSLFLEKGGITHNNIYRGALLAKHNSASSETPLFSNIAAVGEAVSNGDFSNIYIGDRIITKMDGESNDITFYVVGINWYKDYNATPDVGSGKGAGVKPHLCLFPGRHLPNSAATIGNNSTGFKGTNIFKATKRGNNSLADRIDSALNQWTINSNRFVTNNTDNSNGEWILIYLFLMKQNYLGIKILLHIIKDQFLEKNNSLVLE